MTSMMLCLQLLLYRLAESTDSDSETYRLKSLTTAASAQHMRAEAMPDLWTHKC